MGKCFSTLFQKFYFQIYLKNLAQQNPLVIKTLLKTLNLSDNP